MSQASPAPQDNPASAFEQQAQRQAPGLLAEFVDFLRHNKRWWLVPIVVILLGAGLIIMLGGSVLAPFIYPIF